MAIPHHAHIFEIPTATRQDVAAGVASDKVVVPAALGSAAVADVSAFATAEQGARADRAVTVGRAVTAGEGLKGGGSLAADIKLELDPLLLQSVRAGETALQKAQVGALAFKDRITPADIKAGGTASHLTVLHGDGVWRMPAGSGGGGGDMPAAVYDPRKLSGDVFDMDNMTDGAVNKAMTGAEKTKLAGLPADAVSARTKIHESGGLSGGGALDGDITVTIADDVAAVIGKAEMALQKSDVGDLAFKNRIAVTDIAAAQKPTDAAFLRGDGVWAAPQISAASVLPARLVVAFAMQTPPEGWLACDGAHVSRATYAALFHAIGTLYGNGDGRATFKLPDLRGEFIRGWDNGRGVDPDRFFGLRQGDTVQRMYGTVGTKDGQNAFDVFTSANGVFDIDRNAHIGKRAYPQTIDVNDASTAIVFDNARVAKTSSETRPRNIALLYCIKY